MKRILIPCLFFILISNLIGFSQEINILVIMPNQYGANYNYNRDDYAEFGWNVTLAGLTKIVNPCAAFAAPLGALPVTVDVLIPEIKDVTQYDCIAIMPSSGGHADLLNSEAMLKLISTAADSGVILWATCTGVRVLAKADVIRGRRVVGKAEDRSILEAAGAIYLGSDHPPVIDGNIITCVRDQYYHIHNNEAIAIAIERCNQATAQNTTVTTTATQMTTVNQAKTVWTKTFGGASAEGVRAIYQTSCGAFMMAGYTFSFGAGNSDVYLIKTDPEGNLKWAKAYGGPGWEYGNSICPTSDEGFIITGYTTSFGTGSKDVYVIKINSSGDTLWTKTFGGAKEDVGKAACETADGGLLICGYTNSSGKGEEDALLIKTTAAGDLMWTKTFGHARSEMGMKIIPSNDGGFLIAGVTGSPNLSTGNQDFYLIKIDSDGNELSTKTFGNNTSGHPFDWCNSITPTRDSSYVLVGNSDARSPLEIYVVKTDASGNKTWIKNYGEPFYDYGNSIIETNEGSYLIGGTTKSAQGCNNDIALLLINADGNEIWKKSIGGSGADWGNAVCQTNDGSFVIAGHTNSYGAGKFDVLLMKIPNLNPRFNALPNSGHQPLQVEFQDQSTGDVSSWQWDFDNDGTIDSHQQNPAWIYNQAGTYSVRLMISSNAISDTVIQQDLIRVFDGQSALQFDGKTSAVSCPASSSLHLTEKFSIEAWIHPFGWGKAGAMGMARIVDKKNFVLYLIGFSPAFKDHSLALQLKHTDNSLSFSTSPDSSIKLNDWQHVAVTYDGSSNQVTMYINGVAQTLSQTRTPSGYIADHAIENLMIGNNSTRGYTFDGIIDEVRIWNVVRTPEEIQKNMNSCFTKAQSGLVGCWSLNEGNGEKITDLSGNQNIGTALDVMWVQSLSLTPTQIKKAGQNSQPKNFVLYPNYPNPFNSRTIFQFNVPLVEKINCYIYNLQGQLVKSLADDQLYRAGFHSLEWDGTDHLGQLVSSGLYLYSLETKEFKQTRKMLYLK